MRLVATPQETELILKRMKQDLASTPVFPSSNKVGGQVAGDTRSLAVVALVISCLGIILYLVDSFPARDLRCGGGGGPGA